MKTITAYEIKLEKNRKLKNWYKFLWKSNSGGKRSEYFKQYMMYKKKYYISEASLTNKKARHANKR